MSAVPLPRIRCGLPKTRKYPIDVPGTANISYGHKLRERASCRTAKYDDPRGSAVEEERPEDRRRYELLVKLLDFEKETNRKIKHRNLRQRIEQGMSAYEESLRARRERLRDLILDEEASLTMELVDEAQRGDDARLAEMRERTEELRKRQCEERDAVVAAKRAQQHLASCQEVKRELSKRTTIEVKRCNVVQIGDNEARRLAERELDALWHRIMLKELDASKRKETEDSEKRLLAQRETTSTLAKQLADRLALEEEGKRIERHEREQLERLWEDVRRAELSNLEVERRKRRKLKGELEQQILTARRLLDERAREEAAVDSAFRVLAEDELIRERIRATKSTAALRTELQAYLKYLEELRLEEAKRNLEVEATIEQSRKDVAARRELAVKKFKEARERALQEVLRGREEQLRERREATEMERRLKIAERNVLEGRIEMDANLTATEQKESRQKALRYGRDLKEQQEYVERMRRRELEEERRYHRDEIKREEEEYRRLTDELLNASENTTPHPFKILLKERDARHAAEGEERCYRAAALTSA